MSTTLEFESTLTDRYQTTVPETVRRALRLNKRDKIHYRIQPDGGVLITKAAIDAEDDPVLRQFLSFLAKNMAAHPSSVQAIEAGLLARIQSQIGNIVVNLDAPLSADDE